MRDIVLSLGSNIEPEKHIRFAISELTSLYGDLSISPVYQSKSIGFDGPDFLNLVLAFNSDRLLGEIIRFNQAVECKAGRIRGEKTYASRNLDIDVLLFGDENLRNEGKNIPRDEIEKNAYVLKPLSDLIPEGIHPVKGLTYSILWSEFMDTSQTLRKIKFDKHNSN